MIFGSTREMNYSAMDGQKRRGCGSARAEDQD
jgi:hypothetical protein